MPNKKKNKSTPTPVAATESLQNVEEQSIVTENVAAIESTPVEEPVVEEPVVEEPVVEEPVAEEPVAEEPVAEEPVAEEVKSSNNDLEERVKVLEEKLEKLTTMLICFYSSRTRAAAHNVHDSLCNM